MSAALRLTVLRPQIANILSEREREREGERGRERERDGERGRERGGVGERERGGGGGGGERGREYVCVCTW